MIQKLIIDVLPSNGFFEVTYLIALQINNSANEWKTFALALLQIERKCELRKTQYQRYYKIFLM